ncbi:PA2169 family four-helix-bundle protein [Erythrobacter sp. SD-21]|uniref:ferritin-like domain-containing protein n=1 Tax=Erythrobacter sp. SD-21 TaxID=161528 RepID=UPI000153EEA8|nr:PA2169 family four-helix-bundle protein [Erythrobacter sp. SD-21]EDL47972.1 hypothetical protein ED21_25537 [Erythrobacter sp. SD-21]
MATTVFKSLTDTTFDSVEGYRQAGEKADSPQLKQALQQRCNQRESTLRQMNAELERQGDGLVTTGSMTGEAHQMWQSISSAFESDDEAAAERVEEGEDYIKGKFEEALEGNQLEAQERAVVEQAYNEICEGERFGDMIAQQYD